MRISDWSSDVCSSDLLDGDAVLSANYIAAWALLPNLGLDAIATPLLAVVPPLLAGKLIVGLILLVEFSGVIFLHRTLHGRADILPPVLRSEECSVGKECFSRSRSRCAPIL